MIPANAVIMWRTSRLPRFLRIAGAEKAVIAHGDAAKANAIARSLSSVVSAMMTSIESFMPVNPMP